MPPSALANLPPAVEAFRADVLAGLSRRPRRLPCKYFYDQRGSELFDRICELDEYYPTRTELWIMRAFAAEMAQAIGPGACLVEFGSGSSMKTRLLLDVLSDLSAYVPVDISSEHLQNTSLRLAADYPALAIRPLCADFTDAVSLPWSQLRATKRVVYFPGSTIGNFRPRPAQRLLARIARLAGQGGGVLIGIDLLKDRRLLEAAYNDTARLTAEFNLNMLVRINRELAGTFDLAAFRHRATYNSAQGRIEMHLASTRQQTVLVGNNRFHFESGETICTEHSHKYTVEQFAALATPAGLRLRHTWTDLHRWFAVLYFTVG